MRGFKGYRQHRPLLREFDDRYFENLRSICKERGREFGKAFTATLYPFFPEEKQVIERTRAFLKTLGAEDEQILLRDLRELLDEMERAAKCRLLESSKA